MSLQGTDYGELPAPAAPCERIKILFIIDYFHRTGGTEKHLAQLVTGLPANEFSCSIVVFDLGTNPLLDDLRRHGVPIISLPVKREYVPNAAFQGWRLARLIRRNRYNIVQTMHQKADTYGALTAWLSGCRRLVSSKRDTGELRRPWHSFLNRRLRSLFQVYIMVSAAVGAAVTARDRVPRERVVTIYNGVDTARFRVASVQERAEARARLGFALEDFVVGMVAGFRPEKNHDMFFDGLKNVLSKVPSLRVLAVGAGPELARFQREIAATELGARTTFTGAVDDVLPYLWAMDAGCLTPGSNEGFSNSVLEQMAVGVPMVVTDVGGNSEAIVDGESGRVVRAFDSGALARALIDLHSNSATRVAMSIAARRRIEERFSLQQMCAEHASLYRVLNARKTKKPSAGGLGAIGG